VLKLTKLLKETYKNKVVILLYSWRTEQDIKDQHLEEYLSYIDELCLGEYMHSKHVDGFPASTNQKYSKNRFSLIV
jgi:anaerobic ribonucleoside-triphosphate reductase activating protein